MSLMAFGYKVKKITALITAGTLSGLESVIAQAKEMNLAESYGLTQDTEKLDLWYAKLAENLLNAKEPVIPDVTDIGFGEELVEKTSQPLPQKEPRKFLVTRKNVPGWQDAVVVNTYTKEEALALLKVYYQDFEVHHNSERMGFEYREPAPETEKKYKWRQIDARRPGSYANYVKNIQPAQNYEKPVPGKTETPLTDKTFFPAPRDGDRRFELCGYLVLERDSQVFLYTGSPIFGKSVLHISFEKACENIRKHVDAGME